MYYVIGKNQLKDGTASRKIFCYADTVTVAIYLIIFKSDIKAVDLDDTYKWKGAHSTIIHGDLEDLEIA
jgi:hypothetical protein